MFAIIGAAGNVGRATARALRDVGAPVRAILRDAAKGAGLEQLGCEIAVADLQDGASLVDAITGADALQLIIPLRPQATDPVADMHRSIGTVMEAIEQARPKRVLLISDYGAHVDHDIGLPSLFRDVETRLHDVGGDVILLRSAEHMHNWGRSIPAALETGRLVQFQDPVDMDQPTIAAQDLGRISAELLARPARGKGFEVVHAEGPRRYSASDVAAALGALSGSTIHAVAVPRTQSNDAFAGTPPSLADLLVKTSDAKNQGGLVDVAPAAGDVRRGTTELIDALRAILPQQ